MNQTAKPNETLPPPKNKLLQNFEWFALDIIHTSTHLVIETLENGQQILVQIEKLGHTGADLIHKLEHFNQEMRHTSRAFASELNNDAVETLQEVVKGAGQVAQTALGELEELGKMADDMGLNLFNTFQQLSKPFRKDNGKRTKGKEPTIIPITIQDN